MAGQDAELSGDWDELADLPVIKRAREREVKSKPTLPSPVVVKAKPPRPSRPYEGPIIPFLINHRPLSKEHSLRDLKDDPRLVGLRHLPVCSRTRNVCVEEAMATAKLQAHRKPVPIKTKAVNPLVKHVIRKAYRLGLHRHNEAEMARIARELDHEEERKMAKSLGWW